MGKQQRQGSAGQKKSNGKKTAVTPKKTAVTPESNLNQPIDDVAQLSAGDVTALQRTYGNHFLQRLGDAPAAADEEGTLNRQTEERIQRRRGEGHPLPPDVQGQMEEQMGADFGDVRIHHDADSDQLSRSLRADAFTTDKDIFFAEGKYEPHSEDGQKLLAHELTHVVQQGGTRQPGETAQRAADPEKEKQSESGKNGAAPSTADSGSGGGKSQTAGAKGKASTTGSAPDPDAKSVVTEAAQTPDPKDDPAEAREKAADAAKTAAGSQDAQAPADGDAAQKEKEKKKEAYDSAKSEKEKQESKAQQSGDQAKKKQKDDKKEKEKEKDQKGDEKKKGKKEKKAAKAAKKAKAKPKADPNKVKELDGDTAREKRYDPEEMEFEEPEPGPLLPTWDQLATGTVQLSLADVEEEYRARQGLTNEEETGFSEIGEGEEGGFEDITADSGAGEGESEKSGTEMANQALKEGVLEGAQEGAASFVADQVVQAATAKIPYADGLINLVQLASDPAGWMQDNVFVIGDNAKAAFEGFAAIGDESTFWGYIAATLEAIIKLVDFLNSIVSLINTIFTIILFVAKALLILSNAMIALAPIGTPPPIFPFAWTPAVFSPIASFTSSVISFLHPINDVLSLVGNILINVKFGLQPLAILFRYLDMMQAKGDPEELEKKQAKLKENVKGFTQTATTKTANNLKDNAVSGVKNRANKRKAKKEIADLEDQANRTGDPELKAKLDGRKEKFKEEFGESYAEMKARKGKKGTSFLKGAADFAGIATTTDTQTGKLKFGRKETADGKTKSTYISGGVAGAFKKTAGNLTVTKSIVGAPIKGVKGAYKLGKKARTKGGRADIKKSVGAAKTKTKKFFTTKEGFKGGMKAVGKGMAKPFKSFGADVKKTWTESRADINAEMAKDAKFWRSRRENVKQFSEKMESRPSRAVERKVGEVKRGVKESRVGRAIGESKAGKAIGKRTTAEYGLDSQKKKTVRKAEAEEADRDRRIRSEERSVDRDRRRAANKRGDADAADDRAREHGRDADRLEQRAESKRRNAQSLTGQADDLNNQSQQKRQQARQTNQDLNQARKTERSKRGARDEAEETVNREQKALRQAEDEVTRLQKQRNQKGQKRKKKFTRQIKKAAQRRDKAKKRLQKANEELARRQGELDGAREQTRNLEYTLREQHQQAARLKNRAETKQALAQRRRDEANQADDDATEARRLQRDAEREAKLSRSQARALDKSAARREKDESGDLYDLRKQKYKDEDWDYRKNAGKFSRFMHWATTVEPTGGQRHGPGALGKQLIKTLVQGYLEEQEYQNDRDLTDQAMEHLSNEKYTEAYKKAKGLNAKKWEDKAEELLKHQGTWGIESEQKQETGDKYEQLGKDIKAVQETLQGALIAGSRTGGNRYPLQVNIHTILPGVPDSATRTGDDPVFVAKMKGNFFSDDSIATPDWFVGQYDKSEGDSGWLADLGLAADEITEFPINGQVSHTYYSIFSPEETPARLLVEPKAVDLVFPNGAGTFTYEPKYKKVESEDGVSNVWIGYEQKEGGERPTFTTPATLSDALEGTPYQQTIATSDPDEGDKRTISAQGAKPGWLTVADKGDGTAVLSGTPTKSDADKEHQVTLRVQDQIGLQYERTFTINVQANQAPSFAEGKEAFTAIAGQSFTQPVKASDPDATLGDQLSISAAQRPDWLRVEDNGDGTAVLSGAPEAADEGTHTVSLQVSDRAGATATRDLTIVVTPAPEENTSGEQVQTKRAETSGATLLIQRQAAAEEEEGGLFADEEDFFAEEEAAPAEAAAAPEPTTDELESEAILSGESEAEMNEETADYPTLAAIGRRAQLIESLPDPPEGMIEAVQGPALAYAHVEVEEYDLRLQQQQIGTMQEHAKGQDVELKGAQTAAAVNKQGVEAQQRDADTKMQAQDDMKGALAGKEGQAKKTDEEGQKGDSFFSKILNNIIQGFGMGAILGVGDNADANAAGEGTQQTSQTTSDTAKSTQSGQKEVDKYQARTMKVRAEADKSHAELEETEDHLTEKRDQNREGMSELQEAGDINAMQLENVQSEKERLQDEHLNAIDEAEMWADEHRSVREEIFLLLEEDLATPAEEQDDRLEEMAP